MAGNSITSWDITTPLNNGNADPAINWQELQLPSTVNGSARVMMQRLGQSYHDDGGDNTTGGSADVITVTLRDGATAYINGMHWAAVMTSTNTTTTPTMNVNAIGAKTIQKYDALGTLVALDIGDNATGLRRYTYLSGPDKIILENPASGGSDSLWRVPLPTIANDVSDAINDISFSEGAASDARVSATGRTQILCAAMIKRLDANWAVGTNAGMRYSGAAITNTWYHLYSVWTDAGAQDYYADPSISVSTVLTHIQAEAGGSDYVHARRVGSIQRASSAIKAFTQLDKQFLWVTPTQDVNVNTPGTSAAPRTVQTPTGFKTRAILAVNLTNNVAATQSISVTSLDTADLQPSASIGPVTLTMGSNASGGVTTEVRTDTSAQVRTRASGTGNVTIYIFTLGWIDPLNG